MAKSPKPFGNHSLNRRAANRDTRKVFYIFCEGAVTEPTYLEQFFAHFGAKNKIVLKPVGGIGTPISIARRCEEKVKELARAAKTDASYEANSEIWAVFDVDEHDHIETVLSKAHKNNSFRCVVSNPCIEIWGLMHIHAQDGPLHRHQAQRILAEKMPSYHHEKNPVFCWDTCKGTIKAAVTNGRNSVTRRLEEGNHFPKGNPSSNFYKLLQNLVEDPNDLWGPDMSGDHF